MYKVIIFSLLFLSSLESRENPFFPKEGLEDIPYTTNIERSIPPLKRAAISLPSKARTIEKVTVTYKTLDGSLETKSIILENSIDWHLPLFISQNYDPNESNSIKTKNINKPTIKSVEQNQKENFKVIAQRNYITFSSLGKELKITSKNTIIRDFLLVKPHRIVLDFKKTTDSALRPYVKENQDEVFRVIRIGNHSGYYRVVIELDGYYRYKLKQLSDGYIFSLE